MQITFTLEPGDAFGPLEAALSTARRCGLSLVQLHTHGSRHGTTVTMQVRAEQPEPVALFMLRLDNLVGVCDVRSASERIERVRAAEAAQELMPA